ncbi:PqqD family peptide modification chaperone [Streptococcus suis]|uniref:PqqD family peptide modification chaperone n=1 Tax=Streptococcus suis TaxID=1307 RepID=UPI001478645E|nr:PqqD family peptide modification chaperone [Streptococcus suis]MCB2853036.1 PqqD family peptide modification chaperone [Streptococcus suis]MCB2858806.1 PqqD family peptide modification chaperone [Streptococcus suis]MCB2865257.1 PqqD family peptide modification chaperone [Streptococcus suis]MCB2867262.1 PqqD family peptide modification chaperone [Streptococcus suis]MCB2871390.1 PqqD family peptide modification chaperone [Streptococcus suis]
MNLNQYKKELDTRVRKLNNNYYLLGQKKSYSVNYLGAVVLKYIGSDIDILDLAKKISNFYKLDNTFEIKTDIINFIKFLLDEGLINRND